MIITNARLPFDHEMRLGSLVIEDGRIAALDPGPSRLPQALDWQGDYCLPGLIELHTDNLEHHFVPRPKVIWPNGLAAVMAHDAQMAAAGVTTVYDALTMGSYDGEKIPRRLILGAMLEAIEAAQASGALRIDHRLHFRCELSAVGLLETLEAYQHSPGLGLVSIMDHTPGQRQWRDLEKLKDFAERSGKTRIETQAEIERRIARGTAQVEANRGPVLALFAGRDLIWASHDDTTAEHIDQAVTYGLTISEFPCSLEAARLAKQAGLATVGGAPNIVRGGSHSGNVSMLELSDEGALDAISSDYVPSALLQAVWHLARREGCSIARHLPKVTRNTASMLGLTDRGWLAPGLRADVIRVTEHAATPLVRAVYVTGQRVC